MALGPTKICPLYVTQCSVSLRTKLKPDPSARPKHEPKQKLRRPKPDPEPKTRFAWDLAPRAGFFGLLSASGLGLGLSFGLDMLREGLDWVWDICLGSGLRSVILEGKRLEGYFNQS